MKRVNGIIIDIKSRGLDHPEVVTVEYEIDGKKYKIKETIKLFNKTIKLGFLPIGQKQIPQIDCKIGNTVTLSYSEEHPENAHIEGNDGVTNC